MTSIAVSGARGFLGRHLCQELAVRGHHLFEVPRAELSSQALVAKLYGIETFIHLAARAHVVTADIAGSDAAFRDANVLLTQHTALAAERAGVKRFIFVSSAGVLGASSPSAGFREDSPPIPTMLTPPQSCRLKNGWVAN